MHWHPAMTRRSQRTRPSRVSASAEVVVAGQPQVVARLPRLAGDDRPGRAQVLPGGGEGGQDRRVVALAVEEELDDVLLGGPGVVGVRRPSGSARRTRSRRRRWPGAAPSRRPRPPAGRRGRRCGPGRSGPCPRPVPGGGPPSRRPRPCVRAASSHSCLPRDPPVPSSSPRCRGTRSASTPSPAPTAPSAPSRSAVTPAPRRARRRTGESTTQVSLLPPPWDELTTSDPLRRATRVRPPRVT